MKTIITLLIITTATFIYSCANTNKVHHNKNASEEQKLAFIKTIDELGYFKYTEPENVNKIKSELRKQAQPWDYYLGFYDDTAEMKTIDFREYICDGETVYEAEGVIDLISEMRPSFEKMNFKFEVTKHHEVWDEQHDWLNHYITINDTKYVIFHHFKGYGWGEAPMRFAQILNLELEKQNINERVYLAYGGNDGRLIILPPKLYDYLQTFYQSSKDYPLEINQWAKIWNVKPLPYSIYASDIEDLTY